MKSRKQKPQSATSIEVSPEDDESRRTRNYIITMGVRTLCLILMVVVQPYGWYSFVFAAGAIFLPYIAVVIANVGVQPGRAAAERPEPPAVDAAPPAAETADEQQPNVLLIHEQPPAEDR